MIDCESFDMKDLKFSTKTQDLIKLIFPGDKKAAGLRKLARETALFATSHNKFHNPPIGGRLNEPNLGRSGTGFVAGWRAAKGGDLWLTWHKIGGDWAFMFWDADPTPMLFEAILRDYPALLVKSVQEV